MTSLLRFASLGGVEGLAHGVTVREGGTSQGAHASFNLGLGSGDDAGRVRAHRAALARALGAKVVLFPSQVHGCRVAAADAEGPPLGEADAATTSARGVALGVLGADCPGVLVVDPARRALAVVHAGWRGVAARVLPAAIDALRGRHGSRAGDLLVGIGPCICPACYEVGPEVAEALRAAVPAADRVLARGRADRWHADLAGALAAQAAAAGVVPRRVEAMPSCTFEDAVRFYSHRRDGARTGRHALAGAWL